MDAAMPRRAGSFPGRCVAYHHTVRTLGDGKKKTKRVSDSFE